MKIWNVCLCTALCVTLCVSNMQANEPEEKPKEPPSKTSGPSEDTELKRLTAEQQRIAVVNKIREEKKKLSMGKMLDDKSELELKNTLASARLKNELLEATAAKDKLALQNLMAAEQHKKTMQELQHEKELLAIQNALATEKQKKEYAELQAEKDRLALQNQLVAEKYAQATSELKNENSRLKLAMEKKDILLKKTIQEINAEKQKLDAENAKLGALKQSLDLKFQMQQDKIARKLAELESGINLRQKKENWRSEVNRDIEYRKKPFKDGVLTISDRRIALNDTIIEGTADFITKRIHYFNNQSTAAPIFIVIDRCPGGSVMEGYRIIKAMEASKAPIHVVVKSFAASMAATIATVAEHSYAYPNAIILHHQPFHVTYGNITQQDEQIKIFKEWAKRVHTPVASKMGISLKQFYKRMYEENSEGDWEEFADEAQKLRWIDHTVSEIREEGYTKKLTDEPPEPFFYYFFSKEDIPDPKNDYVQLPRLKPFDCYFIYNPDNYYRWPQ